jgi:hypothetical protein
MMKRMPSPFSSHGENLIAPMISVDWMTLERSPNPIVFSRSSPWV